MHGGSRGAMPAAAARRHRCYRRRTTQGITVETERAKEDVDDAATPEGAEQVRVLIDGRDFYDRRDTHEYRDEKFDNACGEREQAGALSLRLRD